MIQETTVNVYIVKDLSAGSFSGFSVIGKDGKVYARVLGDGVGWTISYPGYSERISGLTHDVKYICRFIEVYYLQSGKKLIVDYSEDESNSNNLSNL